MKWSAEEKADLDMAVEALERARQSLSKRGKWRRGWQVGDAIEVLRQIEKLRREELEEKDGIDATALVGLPDQNWGTDGRPKPEPKPKPAAIGYIVMTPRSRFEEAI